MQLFIIQQPREIIYSKKGRRQKGSTHLDIGWLDVDEEEVTNNNARRESKAEPRETKHCTDYTHLGFLPKPSDQMSVFNQKLKNEDKEDIINRNMHS